MKKQLTITKKNDKLIKSILSKLNKNSEKEIGRHKK